MKEFTQNYTGLSRITEAYVRGGNQQAYRSVMVDSLPSPEYSIKPVRISQRSQISLTPVS